VDHYDFSDKERARLKKAFEEEDFQSGDLFVAGKEPKRQWFLFVDGNHPWFIFEEKLFNLFEKLKSEGKRAILCGGARMECLYDIEVLTDAVGLDSTILGTHVYS
jgi:hypothetical protein